ncbi:hypothetical protein [Burkholderia ubonensis]|uniref:hypothetical protein n=1 Tax=Burkholderia ubonensis TaxID=101571 RepID=UPI0012FC89A5|nr:hypothetical protein [Burkholderia ubonensis]
MTYIEAYIVFIASPGLGANANTKIKGHCFGLIRWNLIAGYRMDTETKALFQFCIITTVWIVLPLIPAWLTFKITPNQTLGLKGPLQGLTLSATGSFAAYVIVAMLLSIFTWPAGKSLLGRVMGDSTWVIQGTVDLFNEKGQPVPISSVPGLDKASVKSLPNPNVVSSDLTLRVPFVHGEKPTIFIEIPGWGGATISLRNSDTYSEDPLNGVIALKNHVQIRQKPKGEESIGDIK